MKPLTEALRSLLKGETDDAPETLEAYSRDASLFTMRPKVVVYPKDAEDVERLVALTTERRAAGEEVSLTVRAGGTDMSGGPLGRSIVLDVTRHLNRLLELKDGYASVGPGMYYRDFDKATAQANWQLPSYTASREICTVGGMVGNNSGGEKNLKYGKTDRYVTELDVVLADGKVHTLRRLEGDALARKLAEDSFEGELYRRISDLVRTHRDTIDCARPSVSKNSSGYALWDVGDAERGFMDLTRLLVGSQGTLGIVTRITFSLVRPKPYAAMVVVMLKDLRELGALVCDVLAHDPDSFESYDDHTFALAARYFPELAVQMKGGLITLGLSFLPELWMVATAGIPKLVLMAEFRADSQKEALERALSALSSIRKTFPGLKARLAQSEASMRKYWTIRRESFNLLRKKIRGKRTAPFIDDFVVPPTSLPEFLPKLEAILGRYDLTYTIAGHVGDGNFHIIPLIDPKRADAVQVIDTLSHEVYDLVLSYRGSITGEHNDGLVRAPYVEKMFGPDMYRLFKEIKRLFDPAGIFNPGKKIGGSFEDITPYLDLPSASRTSHAS